METLKYHVLDRLDLIKLDKEWSIKIFKYYILAKHSCKSINANVFWNDLEIRKCYHCDKPFPDKYVTLVDLLELDI